MKVEGILEGLTGDMMGAGAGGVGGEGWEEGKVGF